MDDLKVLVIGTCRVYDPIQSLSGFSNLTNLNLAEKHSYVHTTPEVIQRLRFHQGDYAYPSELSLYQLAHGSANLVDGASLDDADAILVEVSSVKLLEYFEHYLQFNHVINRIRKIDQEIGAEWIASMQIAIKSGEAMVTRKEEDYPDFILPIDRKVLSNTTARLQREDELENDLRKIFSITGGRAIFVTHVDAKGQNGQSILPRAALVNSIERICASSGFPVINPSNFLSLLGQREMMARDGSDLNHYSEDKLKLIGELIINEILQKL